MFHGQGTCSMAIKHVLRPDNLLYDHTACSTAREQALWPYIMFYSQRACFMTISIKANILCCAGRSSRAAKIYTHICKRQGTTYVILHKRLFRDAGTASVCGVRTAHYVVYSRCTLTAMAAVDGIFWDSLVELAGPFSQDLD